MLFRRNDDPEELSFITEGPILMSLVKLAWPIMLSQLMQTLYNLVDTLWVGRVGASAVAAISISFPLVFLLISIAAGLTIAGTAIIAQYKGGGHLREANRVMGQMFSFIGLLSIIIGVVGFIFARNMIIMMGAEPRIVNDATGYIRVIFMGMPFMFGFFIFSSVLRGIGDTVTPAVMMFVSVVLNMILDPLLIFGIGFFPELGVQGAAVATIFSRAVVAVLAVFMLIKGVGELRLRIYDLRPNFNIIKLIARIGIPSSVEQSMISLGQLFMTVLVTSFGTMTLAAYGIVNRVVSLPVILAFGLAASA
ncbi:MAG: MATE family efflux transporter, partial [Halanaerobiaceae bacterium]